MIHAAVALLAAATLHTVCAGDSAIGLGPVLGYGRSWSRQGFRCTSPRRRLTCRNLAGHGWFQSRAYQRRF